MSSPTSLPQARSNTKQNQKLLVHKRDTRNWRTNDGKKNYNTMSKHNKQPHANTVLLVQVNTVSLIWPFLILGCVGSAKGLVHHVNYLVWKGCRCQNKCHTEQNTNLCVKWSSVAEWEKKVVTWWMSAYFKTGTRHTWSRTLCVCVCVCC